MQKVILCVYAKYGRSFVNIVTIIINIVSIIYKYMFYKKELRFSEVLFCGITPKTNCGLAL